MSDSGVFVPLRLDPLTLAGMASAFFALYAVMTWSLVRTWGLVRSLPATIQGLRDNVWANAFWALASLCICLTAALASDAGLLWPRLLANALVGLAAAFYAISMYGLAGKAAPRAFMLGVAAVGAASGAVFTFVLADPEGQRVSASLCAALCFAYAAAGTLIRPLRRNSGARLYVAASSALLSAVIFTRAVATVLSDQDTAITAGGALQFVLMAAIVLATIGASVSGPMLAGEALQIQITRSAMTDALTGLCSRRAFFEVVERRLAPGVEPARQTAAAAPQALRAERAVLMIDVDNFKCVNDTFGHQVGDRAIAGCAALLSRALREPDVAARYGGEEFVAFVDGATRADVQAMAERLLESARGMRSDSHPPFTVSIGAALLADGETLEQCIGRADAALYRAKRAGRDRLEFVA